MSGTGTLCRSVLCPKAHFGLTGLTECLFVRRFPSCEHQVLFEHNGKLRLLLEPLARQPFQVRSRMVNYKTKYGSLAAASLDAKWPLVLTARRSFEFGVSMAFVV